MIFRRVHGHVIAINQPGDREKALAKAGAGVGAGVLGAAAAGHVSGEIERRALQAHAASVRSEVRASRVLNTPAMNKHGQMKLFGVKSFRTRSQYMEVMSKHADKAEKLTKTAKAVAKTGNHLAGAAIGAASYKALEHTRFKDDQKTKAAVGAGAGVAASFAIEHARSNKLGANLSFGKMLKSGLKEAAKHIGRFALRKL